MAVRRSTSVRRRDIQALTRAQLVELVWGAAKQADEAAAHYHLDSPDRKGRDMCVISPDEVLQPIEEATGRWSTAKEG